MGTLIQDIVVLFDEVTKDRYFTYMEDRLEDTVLDEASSAGSPVRQEVYQVIKDLTPAEVSAKDTRDRILFTKFLKR